MADNTNILKVIHDEMKYCVQKLVKLINGKADSKHEHSADTISETDAKKFITPTEQKVIQTLNKTITTNGSGSKVLYDDGTYKNPGSPDLIDDSQVLTDKTYSSDFINKALADKENTLANRKILEAITQDNIDILGSITKNDITRWDAGGHSHENKSVLDMLTLDIILNSHMHINKEIIDTITEDDIKNWNEKISHTHANKEVLDRIISDGDGFMVLNDQGLYVDYVHIWSDLLEKPFSLISSDSFLVSGYDDDENGKTLELKYPIKLISLDDYNRIEEDLDLVENTIYIIHDTENGKNSIYLNGVKYAEVNDSSTLLEDGDGTKFLNDKREYVVPNYASVIDDSTSNTETTYSSKKIESRLDEVQYDISHGVEGNLTMYQRTIMNAKNGDVKYFETSNTDNVYKALFQAFKFVDGDHNIEEVIKTYDNTDSSNFVSNPDTIEFGESGMKIKDKYELTYTVDGDYYISEPFNKNDFVDLTNVSIS